MLGYHIDVYGKQGGKAHSGYSPIAHKFLTNAAARKRLIEKEGEENESTWAKYAQLGYEAQRYKMQWLIVKTLLVYFDTDRDTEKFEGQRVCDSEEWPCTWCEIRKNTLKLIRLLAEETYSESQQRYRFIQFALEFLIHLENDMDETGFEFDCTDE